MALASVERIRGRQRGHTLDGSFRDRARNDHGTHKLNSNGWHDHLFMVYWQLTYDVEKKAIGKSDESNANLQTISATAGTHYNLEHLLNTYRGKIPAQLQMTKVRTL